MSRTFVHLKAKGGLEVRSAAASSSERSLRPIVGWQRLGNSLLTVALTDTSLRKAASFGDRGALRQSRPLCLREAFTPALPAYRTARAAGSSCFASQASDGLYRHHNSRNRESGPALNHCN